MGTSQPCTTEEARAATDIARGLGRLLSFASMYPPDHPALHLAADRTRELVGPGVEISIFVQAEAMWVQSQAVDVADREIGRLHDHLRATGIAVVEVDAHATCDDLVAFTVILLEAKQEVARSAGFIGVELSDAIPPTIAIQTRGYGTRVTTTQGATARVIDRILAGLPEGATDSVTHAVGQLVPQIVEQFGDPANATPESTRALNEVLDLCATALRAGVEELLSSGGLLADMSSLLEATEKAVTGVEDAEATELMRDVLRRAAESAAGDSLYAPRDVLTDEHEFGMTAEELRSEIDAFTTEAPDLVEPDQVTEDAETLSVLLHLCLYDPPPETVDEICAILRPGGGAQWGDEELRILAGGILAILETERIDLVDLVVPMLLYLIRIDSPDRLPELLARLARDSRRSAACELLWPHIVNEMLVGLSVSHGAEHFSDLNHLTCPRVEAADDESLRRLVSLDALRKRRISGDILALRRPEVFPLLAHMIRSRFGKRILEQIFIAVRKRPIRWIGARALLCVKECTPEIRDLILQLLKSGPDFEDAEGAEAIAAQVLAREIMTMSEHRRLESWVPDALRALGSLSHPACEPMLERIVHERQLLGHVWPKECRVAAKQALDKQRRERRQRR